MFSCVSFCLGIFWTVSLPHKTQSKTGQTGAINAKVRVNFRNERSRSTPLDPKLMFWCLFSVWVHLEPFCYCTKLTAKRTKLVQLMQKFMHNVLLELTAKCTKLVQLMQKFVPQCLVRIFCNERSWSTPLGRKLMFWCVSFRLGAFWNSFATTQNLGQNAPNWCN